MKLKQHIVLSCLLGAALSLGAHAEPVVEAGGGRIHVEGLANAVQIVSESSRVQRGWLTVQFNLQNRDTGRKTVYYRIDWFDAQGELVGKPEAWKPLLLQGNQRRLIRSRAPVREAKTYQVQLDVRTALDPTSPPPENRGAR